MRIHVLRSPVVRLAMLGALLVAHAPPARAAAISWNGNTSTAWNTGTNWSGGSQPGNGDDVTIPAGLARYPVVSAAAANAKSILMTAGAGAQPTLTISAQTLSAGTVTVDAGSVAISGGTLSTGGAVLISGAVNLTGGSWLCSFGMTVASGGSLSVSGTGLLHMGNNAGTNPTDNLTISAGATFTQSGGTVEVRDITTVAGSPGGTCTQSAGTFKLYQDFKSEGTFTATAGTFQIQGTGTGTTFPATLGPTQFFNLVINADPFINNDLNFSVAGDWTSNVPLDFSGKVIVVTLNGTGTQTVGGTAATAFNTLRVSKASGTAVLGRSHSIKNGDLIVTAGTFDLASFTLNRTAIGGTISVANGASLLIGGTNSFPANFTTHTLGATSTVSYNGTAQTVTDEDYGHLNLSGSGIKTMPGTPVAIAGNFTMSGTPSATAASPLTVAAAFSVGNGCTFGAGPFSHSVGGDFTNNGTFTASTSTFTLNGSSQQTVSGTSAPGFNNLTVNNATGIALSTNVTASATLTFTSGTITTGASKVIIPAGGAVSRTSGHVVGNLQKNVATGASVSRTYEIGDASSYTPLTAVFASVSVAGNLTCSTTAGDHPNLATSDITPSRTVNRYWTMTNGGVTFTTHNTTFTFVAGDLDAGVVPANLSVRRWNGSSWATATVGTRTATTTQTTNQTALGDFQLGNVLSVASSTSTFAFGTQPVNTWLTAQSSAITNDGPEAEAIAVKISTFTQGANTLAISSSANGANQIRAQWSTTSASGPWTDIAAYDADFTVAASLASSATLTLYFRIQTPTSATSPSPYASTLTVTAQ
jgi:hypothetical protein